MSWERFRVEEEVDVFYKASLEILHEDCANTCGRCNGSGEGMADGTTCMACKGWGEIKHGGDGDRWYEVEWTEDDLSDIEIVDGDPVECDECGYNFLEDIKAELLDMRDDV